MLFLLRKARWPRYVRMSASISLCYSVRQSTRLPTYNTRLIQRTLSFLSLPHFLSLGSRHKQYVGLSSKRHSLSFLFFLFSLDPVSRHRQYVGTPLHLFSFSTFTLSFFFFFFSLFLSSSFSSCRRRLDGGRTAGAAALRGNRPGHGGAATEPSRSRPQPAVVEAEVAWAREAEAA